MKKLLRLLRDASLGGLALLAAASAGAALVPTEWRTRQTVDVAAPGLVRVELPPATFDAAQPDLRDLRVVDPDGHEVAMLLLRDAERPLASARDRAFRPRAFRAERHEDLTQLVIETGSRKPLSSVALETPDPYFFKAAHIEISDDGETWRSLGRPVGVFRQFDAEHLTLPLQNERAAFLRITIGDFRGRTISFSGARLIPAEDNFDSRPIRELGAEIARREEFAGETVLTVRLPAESLPVSALQFDTAETVFTRRVMVGKREMQDALAAERTLASGTIYRVAIEDAPASERLFIPLDDRAAPGELLVHIRNGDSPPLTLKKVTVKYHPVHVAFVAPRAGHFLLLSGNPQARVPQYDLAAFTDELRTAAAPSLAPGAPEAMPDYQPPAALAESAAEVPLSGAPLDAQAWRRSRAVMVATAGVQELELDPAVLASAQGDFGDLRLLRAGNQVPYLLERPALARSLPLTLASAPDPKRPGVSRWRLDLPQAGLPLRQLSLTTSVALFRRDFRIYELVRADDGRDYEHTLGAGTWERRPEAGSPDTRRFEVGDRPRTAALFLETDNGDNPPLALTAASATYPVVRLVFKTAETDGLVLAYDQPAAAAPRYDLGLVAPRLLAAPRLIAKLGPEESRPPSFMQGALQGLKGGAIFWSALALVVAVLLVVVARMLPKAGA